MRHYLKTITAAALSVSVAHTALAGSGGYAGDANGTVTRAPQSKDEGDADLNRRVDDLERKMDKILELLENQNNDAPAITERRQSDTETAEPVETPSQLQSGLRLNLFLLGGVMSPRPFNSGVTFNLRPIPIEDGSPVATAEVKVPKRYDWNAFTQVPAMSRYEAMTSQRDTDKQVALQWKGMLQAAETGDYQYVVSIEVGGNSGSSACVGLLQIDDQQVVRVESRKNTPGYGDWKERYATDQGAVNLAAGPHKFSF